MVPEIEIPDEAAQSASAESWNEIFRRVYPLWLQAAAYKSSKEQRFQEWRSYFHMDAPEPPNPRIPTAATPVVRQKADGIRAHIKVAIDRIPLFTARPLTKDAADAVPAMEAMMQRELEDSGSLAEIEKAIDDAVIYGTGVLMLHVDYEDGEPCVGLKHVPILRVYTWPERANPDKLFWFRTFALPYWEMERLAREGYYDAAAVEQVKSVRGVGAVTPNTEDDLSGHMIADDEHAWHTLVEAWLVLDGVLTCVVFHPMGQVVLRYEKDPFKGVLNRPPFYPIYIDPDHYEIWGHGIAEVTFQFQRVADLALNAEITSAMYKSNPPIMVRANSRTHQFLKQGGGLIPGQVVPYDGVAAEEALTVLNFNMNPFNLQMLNLMGQLTEDATVSDFVVPGQPLGGRKTATEVQVTASMGGLKLTNYLRHIQRSLEVIAVDYWKVIVQTKVAEANYPGLPRGVAYAYPYSGGEGKVYLAKEDVRFLYETPDGRVYEVYIPGADRDDVSWVLTGNTTVAEREMRLQRVASLLTPAFLQLYSAARQDPGVYHLLRRYLEALGMGYDVEAILGPEPEPITPGTAALMGFLQGMAGGNPEQGGGNEGA